MMLDRFSSQWSAQELMMKDWSNDALTVTLMY